MPVAQLPFVCLVEDDADVRASAKMLLESTGYRVADFANAEAFLRATDGGDADCLVLDQNMDGMTGLELLEHLRSTGVHTPAIMVTASDSNLDKHRASAELSAVLRKPSAASDMLACVARACDGR